MIVDFGVYYEGYCSDITRTIITGPNPEMEDLYDIVAEAQRESMRIVAPGVRFREIDERSRATFRKHGHARYFVHSVGHGMGLEVHENVTVDPSSVSLLSDNKAQAGNVLIGGDFSTFNEYFNGENGMVVPVEVKEDEDNN